MTRAGLSALALIATLGARRFGARRLTAGPEPAVALDLTLDPGASRAVGHARLRVVNQTGGPLRDVPLWLYANHLATRGKALGDVNYHWLYPGVAFSAGRDDRGERARRRRPGGDRPRRHAGRRAHDRARRAPRAAGAGRRRHDRRRLRHQAAAPLRRLWLRRAPLPADGRLLPDAGRSDRRRVRSSCRAGPRGARARHAARAEGAGAGGERRAGRLARADRRRHRRERRRPLPDDRHRSGAAAGDDHRRRGTSSATCTETHVRRGARTRRCPTCART